jgi:hypothetical protein
MDRTKNELQEMCQKRKLPLPKYTTTRTRGRSHCPYFISIVTVNGKNFEGLECSRKKDAEQFAAEEALLHVHDIFDMNLKKEYKGKVVEDILIIFDIENVLDVFKEYISDSNLYNKYKSRGYIAQNHHMCGKFIDQTKDMNEIELITFETAINDAADILICFDLGRIIKPGIRYVLVTRDKFGNILKNILPSDVTFSVVSTLQDLRSLT